MIMDEKVEIIEAAAEVLSADDAPQVAGDEASAPEPLQAANPAIDAEAVRAMVEEAVAGRVEAAVAAAVAQAEERGRLQGRNEMAARRMAEPGIWEAPGDDAPEASGGDYDGEFLRYVRPSVWDN